MGRAPARNAIAAGLPKSSQVTPLVIILSFVLLTEVVVMAGVLGTRDSAQLLLTFFCISFPVVVAVPFFLLLSAKPWVFYAPRDYGSNIDPQRYISAMSTRTVVHVADNTNRLINDLPQIIERAILKDTGLQKLMSSGASDTNDKVNFDSVVRSLSKTVTFEIEQTEVVRVDVTEFNGDLVQMPVSEDTEISDFLDFLYFEICEHYDLPVSSYGRFWILEDTSTKKRFAAMGRKWSGVEFDHRKLHEKGIKPGMLLKAIKL